MQHENAGKLSYCNVAALLASLQSCKDRKRTSRS